MAHFLFSANYTEAGLAGLIREGADGRRKAIESALESVGGKLESIYWTFGKGDVVLIAELPDNAAAAALSTTVAGSGAATVHTTVLLTADEVNKALRMHPKYRAPGA